VDRRLLTVLGASVALALIVSVIFYQVAVRSGPRQPDKTELRDVVVSTQTFAVGTTIKATGLKVARVPVQLAPKGSFARIEDAVDRPVTSNIFPDEPLLDSRLAAKGSGVGLAPIIPEGMRAAAVRVNDVVGVAGFVLPGMRVDVLVTGKAPGREATVTATALQNILVLSAGQTLEAESKGRAINTPVVTLLVTPQQAEVLALANNEGRIQLALRNSSDNKLENTPGHDLTGLYRMSGGKDTTPVVRPPVTRTLPRPVQALPVARPAPPPPDEVVIIRGSQKTVEVIGLQRSN
jgi:pilus assembly protein CpaB